MIAALYDATKDKVNLPRKVSISFSGFSLAVKQGRCYEKLGLIDSSINVLTPFMFYHDRIFMIHQHYNPSEEIYSSSGYNKVVGEYLSLLRKKYTDEEIKTELEKAKQSFYCDDSMSLEADSLGVKYRTVDCNFQFFDTKVKYLKFKIPDKIPKRPDKSSYDILPKGKPFQDFTETPLYGMIRDL
jgi:hypothetical protein